MKKSIVDIYLECGDFNKAVKMSGMPTLAAHIALLRSGVLKIQDKINYGSNAAKMGGQAEELFQRLVPEAVDANRYWKKNNPVFDFAYRNLKIDVKYSSLHKNRTSSSWSCRVGGSPDFFCVFLDKGKKLEDYYLLLIPKAFLRQKDSLALTESGSYFKDFRIAPGELKETLDMYADFAGGTERYEKRN